MAKEKPASEASQKPIPASAFEAEAYARSHNEARVSAADILSQLSIGETEEIAALEERLKHVEETAVTYMRDGVYQDGRGKLHETIINTILSDDAISAATPPDGAKPTFIILGGRGGSGKSWFANQVYDPKKCVVLDADDIKQRLPEYKGWNAAQVHTESGHIFEQIMGIALALGINVVLDKTMKSADSALADIRAFKAAGYRTEAHYMHLPRRLAAERAVKRCLGASKRYVPVEVILANTTNERTFDRVRRVVDRWSFWDNDVACGEAPVLISETDAQA